MSRRHIGAVRKLHLRPPPARAPPAQSRTEIIRHAYLPGSCGEKADLKHGTWVLNRIGVAVGEWAGVLIGIASSCLGGLAAAVTRYLVGGADALTLAILRWGIGFACLLPMAIALRVKWPERSDWPGVATLGICFFGLFFILYNVAMSYTTAARASLALSTLPLQTMVVGALLRIEPLTARKTCGVVIAVLGVVAALATGLAAAPDGAWRGELIMAAAVLCMAF
jgi:drug/metabolite transporter (DMT)-like permease